MWRIKIGKEKDSLRQECRYLAKMVLFLTAATLFGVFFREAGFPETNVVLLYLLAVFLTASLTRGYLWGILSSVAATLTFNYFFTAPYHSLNVYDASYMLTFAVMTTVAIVTGTFISRIKEISEKAVDREREAQALFQLTSRLSEAKDLMEAAEAALGSVGGLTGGRTALFCFDQNGAPEEKYLQLTEDGKLLWQTLTKERDLRQLSAAGARGLRQTLPEAGETGQRQPWTVLTEAEGYCDFALRGGEKAVGVLRIPAERAEHFDEQQSRFLHSLQECTALAFDRILAVKRQAVSQQQVQQERYRGNLLRAISHDLRTPLSGIMGTAEMIMDMSGPPDPRYELARGIQKDARWLHTLVENILSLTRLQEGKMVIRKQPEAVEEIVGGAIAQMAGRAPDREIQVEVPEEVLLVPMDGKLIMQVLINLLDNAVKHTAQQEEISVKVKKDAAAGVVVFTVADRGEGIDPQDLPNLFETFYTSKNRPVDVQKGIGLGLTICDSIVRQHGGTMEAANREDGPGARFRFTLPLAGKEKEKENGGIS